MKLKLSASQFRALYAMINWIMEHWPPANLEGQLLKLLLLPIQEKMYRRAFDVKKKYSLTLTDTEALTFYLFFQRYPIPSEMIYEQVLISTINNSIHQKFCAI